MADRTEPQNSESQGKGATAANSEQSSGSNAAGTSNNPQDGKDTGTSGETRPRGNTEDPDITL